MFGSKYIQPIREGLVFTNMFFCLFSYICAEKMSDEFNVTTNLLFLGTKLDSGLIWRKRPLKSGMGVFS